MSGLRNLFPNAFYIARREYRTRVQGRSFKVSTAFLAIAAVVMTLAPVGIQYFTQGAQTRIALVAATADVPADAAVVLEQTLNMTSGWLGDTAHGRKPWVVETRSDLGSAEADRASGKLNGVLVMCRSTAAGIPAACSRAVSAAGAAVPDGELAFVYNADTLANSKDVVLVRQAAANLVTQDRLSRAGIDPSEQSQLFAAPAFGFSNPKTSAGASTGGNDAGQALSAEDEIGRILTATALIVLIFIVVLGYGNWVAISVAEEKNSRVMELMLSAAKPTQMLVGKVVGNGLAGFTQYVAVLLGGAIGLLVQGPLADFVLGEGGSQSLAVTGLSLPVLIAFGVFFVLGFGLYAVLYGAVGSMVTRQEDIQQAAMPLMLVCMVGYFAATLGLNAPDAPWVAVLSFVPFFSPYLMLARVMLTTVAPWEIALCLVLLVVTIAGAVWIAARIYRAGVLLYGQRPTFARMVSVAWHG